MKINLNLTSSSPSTTTTTSSFDANLCNSPNNASTLKRLSTVLRRFLCSGSLRTHPFDCVKDVDGIGVECDHLKIGEKMEEGSVMTPGIVARLMGLETMPEFNSKDSIGRSRSVNSVDCWSEFDQNQSQHRRVKSSLSFREMPSFLEEEDDKFFILSFENVHKTKESRSKANKPERNCAELKQRRVSGNKNKENRREKKMQEKKFDSQENKRKNCSNRATLNNSNIDKINHLSSNSSHHKKNHTQPHASTKLKSPLQSRNKKDGIKLLVETKCKCTTKETENSSPVSVLDLTGYTSESESLLSEEDLRLKGLNSRRKLSSELANSKNPSSNYSHNVVTEVAESLVSSKVAKSTRMDCQTEDYLELWGQICMLTAKDMKTSNWITREISKMEDLEAIRIEYSVQIVDQLLHELVVEMAK